MLESKLWLSKTVTKNVKGTKVMVFIETCDQYRYKFDFGHFFSCLIVLLSTLEQKGSILKSFCPGKISYLLLSRW